MPMNPGNHGIPSTHLSELADMKNESSKNAAYASFCARYRMTIYSWCQRKGLQHADAEDLTSDVLMHLLKKLPGYEHNPDRGLFREWLNTVVNNAITDFFRRRKPDQGTGDSATQQQLGALHARDTADDFAESIESAVRTDPCRQRAVDAVRMRIKTPNTWEAAVRRAKDVEAEIIAKDLGMTPDAVYMAAGRVAKMLKEAYQECLASSEAEQ